MLVILCICFLQQHEDARFHQIINSESYLMKEEIVTEEYRVTKILNNASNNIFEKSLKLC